MLEVVVLVVEVEVLLELVEVVMEMGGGGDGGGRDRDGGGKGVVHYTLFYKGCTSSPGCLYHTEMLASHFVGFSCCGTRARGCVGARSAPTLLHEQCLLSHVVSDAQPVDLLHRSGTQASTPPQPRGCSAGR